MYELADDELFYLCVSPSLASSGHVLTRLLGTAPTTRVRNRSAACASRPRGPSTRPTPKSVALTRLSVRPSSPFRSSCRARCAIGRPERDSEETSTDAAALQSDAFQADLFPPAPSDQPALSSTEWLNGKTASPVLIDMETRKVSSSTSEQLKPYKSSAPAAAPSPAPVAQAAPTPKAEPAPAKAAEPTPPPAAPVKSVAQETKKAEPTPPVEEVKKEERAVPAASTNGSASASLPPAPAQDSGEIEDLREENEQLRAELAEKDAVIRELELKLERVRTAMA